MTLGGRERVVIVGGGFGGLNAARALRHAPVDVILIDRRNFHLFQPLLYQVATGSLSSVEIASPLRGVLRRQENARVLLAEVSGIDLDRRLVHLDGSAGGAKRRTVPYDTLIVAAGSSHCYFGHEEWERLAPGLKSIEDALEIRRRILVAFEAAELESDTTRQAAWLTFVIAGAGPTGVELAGQIAEIARDTLKRDFRAIDPTRAHVILVEGADRVLMGFDERLSKRARRDLEGLGVTVRTGELVTAVEPRSVTVKAKDGPEQSIAAMTVIWAAGVAASPLGRALGEASGAEVDRAGRVVLGADLTLPGRPEVFVIGDMALADDPATGRRLPGVAPVAMQQGTYAGRTIAARLAGRTPAPFRYRDRGSLATIGRAKAVGEIAGVRVTGTLAWLTWLFVHLLYLIGFQNRVVVLIRWGFSFLTRGRGGRVITGERLPPPGAGPAPDRDGTLHEEPRPAAPTGA